MAKAKGRRAKDGFPDTKAPGRTRKPLQADRAAADPADSRPVEGEVRRAPAEVPTSFESPESSSVAGASYNFETQQMRVRLLRALVAGAPPDEKSYAYEGVPLFLWADFVAAASKGGFFNARIRPIFVGRRLE